MLTRKIHGGEKITKPDFPKANRDLTHQLQELGVSAGITARLLGSYPGEKIKRKLYLLREKEDIRDPGAYLLSVLKNEQNNRQEKEIMAFEIETTAKKERVARRDYYRKMQINALPKEQSLKWIKKIRQQLQDGEMSCEPGDVL